MSRRTPQERLPGTRPVPREIEAFLAYERTGNVEDAAEELGISKPALASLLYRLRLRLEIPGSNVRVRPALQEAGLLE